jgi:hypothetical protein
VGLILLLVACDRVAALLPGTRAGATDRIACPPGSTPTVDAPEEESPRALAGTEVHTCRDPEGRPVGPHLERWPDGGTACLGAWVDGERDGIWLTWHPDGAFRSQITWEAGQQHGPRREVGLEGRVVEIAMEEGVAHGLVTLAPEAPMPEWEAGRRVDGTRYRSHGDAR